MLLSVLNSFRKHKANCSSTKQATALTVIGADSLPKGEDQPSERPASSPPDKKAVQQLISNSTGLLQRLQPDQEARGNRQAGIETAQTAPEPGSTDRPKSVVLEEALEFEVSLEPSFFLPTQSCFIQAAFLRTSERR